MKVNVNVYEKVAGQGNQVSSYIRHQRAAILIALTFIAVGIMGSWVADAQVNVTTQHNDIGRTGQNLSETILSPSNVNSSQFGKLFSQPVDGQIYAQPLYMSGLIINGVTHNVVYVATENDTVYAFDADSNGAANSTPLWQASLLTPTYGAAPGATATSANTVGSQDISPLLGITGTPVIDPNNDALYVVSNDFENGTVVQRLHALSFHTGAEKFGGPVVITGSVPGTGAGSVNGTLTFDPLWENQRPGLLLLNGIVYVGFASQGDNGPWHGWVFGYNAATLQQTGAFCTTPNGTGAGIWMSGTGLAADQLDTVNHPFGRMFVPTGNGDYNASNPYTNNMDFGDTDVDLDLTNGVPTVTDEFTTFDQAELDAEDLDVASAGLMVLPTQTTGNHPHLAIQTGKSGSLFLLNRDNLGGYNATGDQVVQVQTNAVGVTGTWASPAYWNGTVYYWGRIDHLKAFPLVNGLLSTNPTQSIEQITFPGSTPSISANGATNGIVWTIDSEFQPTGGAAILMAHNASNVNVTLYTSSQVPTRDTAGPAVKFTVPTVANGKVYVGAGGELDFYGLLSNGTQTPAPTFNPGSESFTGTVNVSLMDANASARIYYTNNGAPATTSSTLYTGTPIAVSSDTTINAIASASGQDLSPQASATYTSNTETQAVVFSLPAGTYSAMQVVSLSDPTSNAVIYYTVDGSTPITSATTQTYSTPITINATETITAVAVAPGYTASPVVAQTYTIQEGVTGINFPQGFASSNGLVILQGSTDLDDSRLQLTNGLPNEAGTAWYYQPVDVQTFTTSFSYQLSNPAGSGFTFTIQNSAAGVNALGGSGQNLGYAPIGNSVAIKFDLVNNATGLYMNGAVPLTPAISYSGTPINLYSDDAMTVTLVYNTTTLTMTITDLVTTGVWSTKWNINIPAMIGSTSAYVGFTGSTGAQTSSQKILSWNYINNYSKPFGVLERAHAVATGLAAPAAGDDLFVSGWIADPTDGSPMSNVTVFLDGVSIGKPTLDVSRPDIAASQNNPAYANSGFTMVYPKTLSAGNHSVTVVGIDTHGVMITLGPLAVTVTGGSLGSLDQAISSGNGTTAIAAWDNLIVSGWIADPIDGSPMSNVHVLIDGVAVGTPTLGLPRPDIALSYGDPAFTNSGYTFTYPGSELAGGAHVVTIVGVNSRSVSTTLGPLSITAGPPIGNLEQALDATTFASLVRVSDNILVSGWIADPVDGSPLGNVKVYIDGNSVGTPTLGILRPDVAAAQQTPSYLHSGFSMLYPANSLRGGLHTVTVVGINSHGTSTTLGPRTIVIAAPFGNLDSAVDGVTDKTAVNPWDALYVGGWICDPIDGSPMSNVYVLIDGVAVGTPTLGLPRPDIAAHYNNPAYANAGFTFYYSAKLIAPGTHKVTVVGVDSHGVSVTLGPATINVAPTMGNLDQAEDSTTEATTIATTDNLFVSGWIADPNTGNPLTNVKVLIDGVSVGTPTLDVTRLDIEAIYKLAVLGQSGFTFFYPAKLLTTGNHVVTVVGVTSAPMPTTLGPLTITVTSPPPIGHLEQALDSSTRSTTIPTTDTLFISGWIADPTDGSPMSNVTVFIDGVSIGKPTLGVARPDVAAAQNNPAYGLSGFSLNYPASHLSVGSHVVTVVGVNSHAVLKTLNPLTINVTSVP